ncbi:MAG TPA: MmgE/PrpD family protein [Ramlibacter sp.]|nr:MmgE/PrpD family protein [Ramlibacter sp.]
MDDLRQRCGANVRKLAQWALATPATAIPAAVMDKAARILADDLGAMIGARGEPELVRFQQRMLARRPASEATVFRGGAESTARIEAAVCNALATDWLELDEGYRPVPCHAGLYVLPALLAEAETAGLSCQELLRALVLGYEIVTRVARSFDVQQVVMQSHGRYAALGAAAGVGLAKRLESEVFVAALGAAVTLVGPGPRNHLAEGAMVRNAWPASGAWNGLMAVEWAECGIGGIPEAVFDVYATVLGGQAQPQRLVEGLGEQWAVLDGYTKIYACCQHLHSAVEAALDLRQQHPQLGRPDAVERIDVQTHPLALPLVNPAPRTTLGAKFSMPHAVAAALLHGDAGAGAFTAAALDDAAIGRLRQRVHTTAWEPLQAPPNDRPARVTVHLADGSQVSTECLSARGGPDRPLPADTWRAKLQELAEPAYPGIVGIFDAIVSGDPRRRSQAWPDLVREITGATH